jgi:uncharacterized membrane protein YphA (DoxX/SURF4 family)
MSVASLPPLSRGAAPSRWRTGLGYLGGLVLGLVLLVAAWAKLIHPTAFVEQIEREGLDFLLGGAAVAAIALALEVFLGLALVLGVRRPWVLIPSALLVAFFVFLTGRSWYLDAHGLLPADASCGCFGNLVDRTPKEAFWQDLFLLVPALALAFLGRPEPGRSDRWRVLCIVALTVLALLFAWKAPDLPLDDLATRLKPGVTTADLCAGKGDERVCLRFLLPEAQQGEHYVVLGDLASESFLSLVPQLNDYHASGAQPALWVLVAATPEQLQKFFWTAGNLFEVREAPPALLKPLYRTLPRSFLLRDGVVVATFNGLPPLAKQPS